ncbi:hypothetical protein L2E82_50214 [Cichorium intybus]|nr:hypothetical protein L2E82_50214 [Cichorium intybus]
MEYDQRKTCTHLSLFFFSFWCEKLRLKREGEAEKEGGTKKKRIVRGCCSVIVFARSIRCSVLSLVGFAELPHGFLHCRLEVIRK